MGARQRIWATKVRRKLLIKYGNRCAITGCRQKELEFDSIIPTNHTGQHREQSQLACYYRQQDKIGNLQILCKKHNREKSDKIPF